VLDVAELIVAQRYRLKGCVFVSWCSHWDYTLAQTLGLLMAGGCFKAVTQMSTLDMCWVYRACNMLISFSDCLEMLGNSDFRILQDFFSSARVNLICIYKQPVTGLNDDSSFTVNLHTYIYMFICTNICCSSSY